MKKIRFLSIFLSLLFILQTPSVWALTPPELACGNAILVDANHGEVLFEQKAYEKAYPASITKIMTALLVLEAISAGQLTPSQMVTAHESAFSGLSIHGSTANIKAGDSLTVEDLLYCLMLPSANEAANILAEAVDGTVPDFVDRMNRKAAQLGAKNTYFVNPHGLHDPNHYTCAYDVTLFLTAALKHDLFRTIIKTASYTIHFTDKTGKAGERFFYNTNGLISNLYYAGYVYDKCIGGKTGTTDEAGRCLAAAAESGDTLLISVILGSGVIVRPDGSKKQGQFTESITLLQYGFDNFHRVTITRDGEPVDKVAVTLSRQADEVMVKPQGAITRTLPKDMDTDLIESEIHLFATEVEAPVTEGQVLGSMTLSYEGEEYGTMELVAVTSVERSELLYKKAQVLSFFQEHGKKLALGAGLLLAGLVALCLFLLSPRRSYRAGRGRRSYRGSRRR